MKWHVFESQLKEKKRPAATLNPAVAVFLKRSPRKSGAEVAEAEAGAEQTIFNKTFQLLNSFKPGVSRRTSSRDTIFLVLLYFFSRQL